MPFITQTNLKYILIVIILAVIVGGGILAWQFLFAPKKEIKPPEIKLPQKTMEEPEKAIEEEPVTKEPLVMPGEVSSKCTFPTKISNELLLEKLDTYSKITVVPSDFSNWPSLITGEPIKVRSGAAAKYESSEQIIKTGGIPENNVLDIIITEYSEESMEEFEFYKDLILNSFFEQKAILGLPVSVAQEPPVQNEFIQTWGDSSIVALVPNIRIIIAFAFDEYQEKAEKIFTDWLRTICINAPPSVQTPAPQPTAEVPVSVMVVNVSSQNNSGESGIATLTAMEGKTHVKLVLSGAPARVTQPAHIHTGSCVAIGGVKYPLTFPVDGTSETMLGVSLQQLLSELPLAINVHKSPQEASVYVACGDIAAQ